jgi:hypothetical protein
LPFDPRFTGSNPTEGYGFLRAIKICGMPSFTGEVKPSTPYRSILQHVKDSFKV